MIHESNNEFVALSDVVRKQYVLYLERQLQENVKAWAGKSRNHHQPTALACIPQSVIQLEDRALKACMAAQVYQRVMVKMITVVRKNTQDCRLANIIFEQIQSQASPVKGVEAPIKGHQLEDKTTQTGWNEAHNGYLSQTERDEFGSHELQRKIDLFQASLEESEAKNESLCKICRCKTMITETNHMDTQASPVCETEDEVAQELATLFGDDRIDLNDIFGIEPTAVTDDPQISVILEEIEKADLPGSKKTEETPSPTVPSSPSVPDRGPDLRQSRWPCELYAQRKKLNACLIRSLEADWRCEDRLREIFRDIFGEDSDDEFATEISSPSIDLLDEVLLSSCLRRICPWIVCQLMGPLEDGLIANRFLFKKLAKQLAHSIVMINPYCSEQQIKTAVEQLFCLRPGGIQSAHDLTNLPALDVEKFDTY
ncbi:hypothetical protein KR026_005026 [Drosophila bipectinata]|nr:hypothetical protein KR026_005026 [Drosophila bipectinata]